MQARPFTYRFGEFTLDPLRGSVHKAGEEIKLRPKVYETLLYLVKHAGQLIGKQELMQVIWPDSAVTDDSLVQCALELRRALDDHEQRLFKTVPRRGYVFTAQVTSCAAGPDNLPSGKIGRKNRDLPVSRTSLIGRERQLAASCLSQRATHTRPAF